MRNHNSLNQEGERVSNKLTFLLSFPKKELNKIFLNPNEWIFNRVYTLTDELDLNDSRLDYEIKVTLKYQLIKKFPDTVFWDYASYYDLKGNLFHSKTLLISTKGDSVTLAKNGKLYINLAEDWIEKKDYRRVWMESSYVSLHRVVASTFIPKAKQFKVIDYKNLQVNHKDLKKGNNCVTNLEWLTMFENIRHRYGIINYNRKQYFLFEVAVDNGFLGRQFILSEDELHLVSKKFSSLRTAIKENIDSKYKGFIITILPNKNINEIEVGFPKDIRSLYEKDTRYFDSNIKPIIGMVLKGEYKGFQFSLFGKSEIQKYFNQSEVQRVSSGKGFSHHNCTFKYSTHREAIPLHGKLTREIKGMLNV